MVYDAQKEAKKLSEKASKRYAQQAKDLKGQLSAQTKAIKRFGDAYDQRLANILTTRIQADQVAEKGYKERTGSLDDATADNEKSFADQAQSSFTNASRERMAALQQVYSNGGGESDTLKASLMSARNLQNNLGEGTRSAYDTLRAINQSQTDLNIDTRTARINNVLKANADRDAAYTDYANRMSDAYTQMGNVAQQQAELYGLADEQKDGYGSERKSATKAADKSFSNAADWAGKVYKNPGIPDSYKNWTGKGERKLGNNTGVFENAVTTAGARNKPTGATLRKWTV